MGERNVNAVPPLHALFVFMLLPTAILFIAALLTSLLLTNYDPALSGDCNTQVRVYLFGCVLLFYLWSLYHFFTLFGSFVGGLVIKIVFLILFVIAFGLWVAFGHLVIKDQINDSCKGTVYHWMTLADLACCYIYFGMMIGILIVSEKTKQR
jgi:hypothetical protein